MDAPVVTDDMVDEARKAFGRVFFDALGDDAKDLQIDGRLVAHLFVCRKAWRAGIEAALARGSSLEPR